MRAAPARKAWIGPTMRRARNRPARKASRRPRQQQRTRSLDRVIERRIGLVGRKLDEHQPAERRDRRIGREHLAAADVGRLLHLLGRAGGDGRARRLDLRQLRHVGIAQHQADVGMRDEAALRVDHVGLAVLADLDLRDHVPDQLEIDLGDADAGIAPRAGERQRHVGLGFAAEIDRAVIDLLGHRLGELRLLGEIGLARDHVHGEPRHLELLAAGGVELRQLGDRRHLAQQPQAVEAPLLERARRPWQLRRPADLALDLLDELPDLGRRGFRLLALDADQRGLVLAVGEIDLEQAVGEQRHAHHGQEQRDIFAEQCSADLPRPQPVASARKDLAEAPLHSLTRRIQSPRRHIAETIWGL